MLPLLLYFYSLVTGLFFLVFAYFVKQVDEVTTFIDHPINFLPLLFYYFVLGATVLILWYSFPGQGKSREIRVPLWNIIIAVFFGVSVFYFFTKTGNLRYVSASFLDKYGLVFLVANFARSLTLYFAVLCLVSGSGRMLPPIVRLMLITGHVLMIDGLASGLASLFVIFALFPHILKAQFLPILALCAVGLLGYSQWQKSGSYTYGDYLTSVEGATKYSRWIIERFSVHSYSLNYYLSDDRQNAAHDVLWTIDRVNLEKRWCILSSRLQGLPTECRQFDAKFKSFSNYNYSQLQGIYDKFGGASPGLLASSVVMFGPVSGAVMVGILFFLLGAALQRLAIPNFGGFVSVFILLYFLDGALSELTDIPLIFSGATLEVGSLIFALSVGTKKISV